MLQTANSKLQTKAVITAFSPAIGLLPNRYALKIGFGLPTLRLSRDSGDGY
jgi:hypothetical protein